MEIAKSNGVNIDILHIMTKKEIIPFDPYLLAFLKERAGEIYLIEGTDTIKEIKKFTEKNQYGLLMMIRRPKNLLLITIQPVEKSNGNMKLDFNNTNTWLKKSKLFSMNSTDLFMRSNKRQVLETSFLRRRMKQLLKQMKNNP